MTSKRKELAANILLCTKTKLHESPFLFKNNIQAAEENWNILYQQQYQLPTGSNDITNPSFEFNSLCYIKIILEDHPSWNAIESVITRGISYPLKPIDEEARLSRLKVNVNRGNHPIHNKDGHKEIDNFINKEIANGWLLPIPTREIFNIPNAEVCPMHLVTQDTINDKGETVTKFRPCHDLTFSSRNFKENMSVNNRHMTEQLPSIQYGRTFERVIHFIAAMRHIHPNTPILLMKFHIDSAFRRLMLAFNSMVKTIFTLGSIAYMSLRMPFGATSSSNFWSVISEPMTDVMNQSMNFNEIPNLAISSRHYSDHFQKPSRLSHEIPFQKAFPLITNLMLPR